MTEPTSEPPSQRPSSLRYQALVTAAIVVAALALFAGIRATESSSGTNVRINGRPDVVEHVVPTDGAQVLHQSEIGIDLAPGYEGALVLNGTAIPTEELRIVAQQNQVFFAPGDGRTFAALPSGRNCATAIVWKSAAGRGTSADLTFQWCFDVT
ncbi:MAG: hypothetical protein ACT4OV_03905 [Microthrixaceae bacterium]